MHRDRDSFLRSHSFQIALLFLGVAIAVALGRSDLVQSIANSGTTGMVAATFIFGAMYSSMLTVAPATVGLFELAAAGVPIWMLALIGGFGATLTDITLFQIIKLGFIDEVIAHLKRHAEGSLSHLFQIPLVKTLVVIVGAVSIATPIPDEIGLAMMGIGQARWSLVAAMGFVFNTLGIACIGLIAR